MIQVVNDALAAALEERGLDSRTCYTRVMALPPDGWTVEFESSDAAMADQVLARISPNVSVWAVDPEGDPLGIYLRSLERLEAELAEDTLVLPGHNLPFHGLHIRIGELKRHHEERCAAIERACRTAPRSASELVPVIFHRTLDPHQLGFAFSEVLAHVNYMLCEGRLSWAEPAGGTERVIATGRP